jgi:hypothetical protein
MMHNCLDMNTKAASITCSTSEGVRSGGCEMCLPKRSVCSPLLSFQPLPSSYNEARRRRNSIECKNFLYACEIVAYTVWKLTVDFCFLQSLMKHAGKNNIKNVNSLTLGDEQPKIDTGQKINSNHHIGSNPAQVSHKIQSFLIRMSELQNSVQQTWTLNRRALCHICFTYVICLSTLLLNVLCLCVYLFVGVNNSNGCLTLTYCRQCCNTWVIQSTSGLWFTAIKPFVSMHCLYCEIVDIWAREV